MNNEHTCIYKLLGDESYRKLLEIDPPFNLFEALDVGLKENPSSRILAYLLNSDRSHGLGTAFLDAWLNEIFLERAAGASTPTAARESDGLHDRLLKLLRTESVRSQAQVEWSPSDNNRRVDILIRLFDPSGTLTGVIGVENKHWAAEQDEQVSAYQTALVTDFIAAPPKPPPTVFVLFLSPSGNDATTGSRQNTACPYIRCSYRTVLRALKRVEPHASPQVALFLSSTREYLADKLEITDMTDEDTKARELVRTLFQNPDHRKALDLIQRYLPTGRQLAERVENLVRNRLTGPWGTLAFQTYPDKRSSRTYEAKWTPTGTNAEIPFIPVFMLRPLGDEDWAPDVRIYAAIVAKGRDKREMEGLEQDTAKYRDSVMLPKNSKDTKMSTTEVRRWTWGPWLPLSVSKESHTLGSLQDDDAEALLKLLKGVMDGTSEQFRSDFPGGHFEPRRGLSDKSREEPAEGGSE